MSNGPPDADNHRARRSTPDDHIPHLGTAANYAVLATDAITNTEATTIDGGLALTGTSVSGAPAVIGLVALLAPTGLVSLGGRSMKVASSRRRG